MQTVWKLAKAVTLVGQLGFTLLTPPIVLILLAFWLQTRFGLGSWIMFISLIAGLLTSAASALQFYRRVILSAKKKTKEEKDQKTTVFYTHE